MIVLVPRLAHANPKRLKFVVRIFPECFERSSACPVYAEGP